MISDSHDPYTLPPPLQPGDKIRFVSPASSPDHQAVAEAAEVLAGWGFAVEFGRYAFEKLNYLAGTDQQRIDDLNDALRDPSVRAVFATRGGKGSYRIANKIDFDAARRDPKFMVGFSDITAIHCACAKHGIGVGIHRALYIEDRTAPDAARGPCCGTCSQRRGMSRLTRMKRSERSG